MKKKKLLILAGQSVHCKVVEAAKELGFFTVVADYLQDSPAKRIADESVLLSITDVEAITEYCRKNKIDGVLNYCNDLAQIPYHQICENLGLPCYSTGKSVDILTNKREFKKYCRIHGLDVVPDYSEEDIDAITDYPVLVKPTDSRGSRGQTVCRNVEELRHAIDRAKSESRENRCVIEKYMGGKQDFSLVYLVIDSEPYLMKIGDRYIGRAVDNLDRQHICTLLPSVHADEFINGIEQKIKNFIKSLGISFGPVFFQGFYDDGKVFFYDPGMRFPGSDYDLAVVRTTGFNPIRTMVRFAMTGDSTSCEGDPRKAFMLNGKTCMILSIAVRPGVIIRMQGFETIRSDSRICSFSQNYTVGDTVPDSGDYKQRIAELIGVFNSREEAMKYVTDLYKDIAVEDIDGDMVVSKIGIDIPF